MQVRPGPGDNTHGHAVTVMVPVGNGPRHGPQSVETDEHVAVRQGGLENPPGVQGKEAGRWAEAPVVLIYDGQQREGLGEYCVQEIGEE